MPKSQPAPEKLRRRGAATDEQPYSVDPASSPEVGKNAAGPKRRQAQEGQALDESRAGNDDGK